MDTLTDPRTDVVRAGRERIDALDAELVRLIAERAAVSAEVQRARRAAGGPRIVQSRENEVVGRWHAALGRPGSAIALALLELGRGPG
jgi:chorismate mutase